MPPSSMPHRHKLRLTGYDYALAGAYFITIVIQEKLCLFGRIVEKDFHPNPAGKMIEHWWLEIPHKFPTVELGEFIVMPSHFHAIIYLRDSVGADLGVRPEGQGGHTGPPLLEVVHQGRPGCPPLPEIVQWFKTMTTNAYIQGVKATGWEPFRGRLWQRSYYDRIVRNEVELENLTKYIQANPANWSTGENGEEII